MPETFYTTEVPKVRKTGEVNNSTHLYLKRGHPDMWKISPGVTLVIIYYHRQKDLKNKSSVTKTDRRETTKCILYKTNSG
jgi:hypothetical protein